VISDTAKPIADAFMPAALGALESITGVSYSFTAGEPQEGASEALAAWCRDHPVSMYARIDGGGAVAMLWAQTAAAPVVAALSSDDPAQKTSVGAEDEPVLTELTGAVLGAGAAGLASLLGTDVLLGESGASAAQDPEALRAALGDALIGIPVPYEGGGMSGSVILVYSEAVATRIAANTTGESDEEPTVSEEELNDILSGFGPEDETDHTRSGSGEPENLSVVMDIELTATARLGMVEVPLAEVLRYGPGSIIEMGRTVDEPIELLVNGKLIARGDVVVVDEKFGLRITEIVSQEKRIESIR